MSHAYPVLYRTSIKSVSPNDAGFDQTVLGTPVPVAHSTVSQTARQRTYVIGNENPVSVALPILEHSTDTIHASPKAKDSAPLTNGEPSILNIDSMQGLSGSVLDQSLQARTKMLSVAKVAGPMEEATHLLNQKSNSSEVPSPTSSEEAEADAHAIQFDEAELKCLEDAFSDLDCVTSEAEATLPTKACATVSFARHENHQNKTLSQADDSATTVSSLRTASESNRTSENQSNTDSGAAVGFHNRPDQELGSDKPEAFETFAGSVKTECIDEGRGHSEPNGPTSNELRSAASLTSPPLQSLLAALTAANSITPINQRQFSHLPCLTFLSSIGETEAGLTKSSNDLSPPPHPTPLETPISVKPETVDSGLAVQSTDHPATVPTQLPLSVADTSHTSLKSIDHLDLPPCTKVSGDAKSQCVVATCSANLEKVQVSGGQYGSSAASSSIVSKTSVASFTSVTEISLLNRTKASGLDVTPSSVLTQPSTLPSLTAPITASVAEYDPFVPPRSSDNKSIRNAASESNESRVEAEQSTMLVSCLHMSDVDGLLDIVGAGGENNRSTDRHSAQKSTGISSSVKQLNKLTVARLRAIRSTSTHRNSGQGQESSSSASGVGLIKTQTVSQDENLPPTARKVSDSPSSAAQIFSEPQGVPQLSQHPRRHSAPRSVLHEHQASMIATAPSPAISHTLKPDLKRTASVSTAPVVSPLLSNTDCLIWCGASCGVIQYQDLLIKHQMERPVSVQFTISTGSEVFKLVNELGYLLSGAQTVQLPPGLEYAVKIAYVAQQPLAWDTGQLQLSLDEPSRSVWKVRLIGYSNNSQLICSCCKRLSSEVYWTTAVKVHRPIGVRPSLARKSPVVPRVSDAQSFTTSSLQSSGDTSITAVVLTNCGSRVAWVWACAEALPKDETVSGGAQPISVSTEPFVDSSISIEPSKVVIGPMHSQQITITMRPGLKACRIVFYYGDEVLRHQIRQHFILPAQLQTEKMMVDLKRGGTRKARRQIRIVDLMRDFVNEVPFPIAEIPSSLKKPIRPEDWRRALSQQLRLHQRIILNVYALPDNTGSTETQSEDMNTTVVSRRSDSPTTLASIHVEKGAFQSRARLSCTDDLREEDWFNQPLPQSESRRHSSGHVADCTRSGTDLQHSLSTSSRTVPVSTQSKRSNSRHVHLTLNPAKVLVFPVCTKDERTIANFVLALVPSTDYTSDYACKIMWSAFPVTDVVRRFHAPDGAESQSSCDETIKDAIFESIHSVTHTDSIPSIRGGRTARGFGLLFPAHRTIPHDSTTELCLPFAFNPHRLDSPSSYTQDWCITVWAQPTTRLPSQRQNQEGLVVDVSDRNTSQFVFPVTLEGQYHTRADRPLRIEKSRSSIETSGSHSVATFPSQTFSSSSAFSGTKVHRSVRLSRSGRVMEVGPLLIAGLPVSFKPIERSSESPRRTHELELMNLKHPGLLFVKLELPKAPFNVETPRETHFRILPDRCVRVLLSYCPTEPGTVESVLGVEVMPLPVTENTDRLVEAQAVYKAKIAMSGVMN